MLRPVCRQKSKSSKNKTKKQEIQETPMFYQKLTQAMEWVDLYQVINLSQ